MEGPVIDGHLPREDDIEIPRAGGTLEPIKTINSMDAWLKSPFLSAGESTAEATLDIRDFINFVRYESQETAWFTNEMIDWALEAVRAECKIGPSSAIVIANTNMGSLMYRIGNGNIKVSPDPDAISPDDRKSLEQRFPEMYKALKGKRYVFLPVNNGMAQEAEPEPQQEQKEKKSKEKQRKTTKKADAGKDDPTTGEDSIGQSATDTEPPKAVTQEVRHVARGTHWSFILVDTKTNTARYIDGIVGVERNPPNKHKITNIESNGHAAGAILCGFEIFMNRERDGFTASTLKWIPHQSRNNKSVRTDGGPCGPYMYALMKYILQNRTLTLRSGGIKRYFNESQKAERINRVNFNSVNDRISIQKWLWARRQQDEKASAGSEKKLYPANLDPLTLPAVFTPAILNGFVNPRFLRQLLDIHDPQDELAIDLGDQQLIWIAHEWSKRLAFAKEHGHFPRHDDISLLGFRKAIWADNVSLRRHYNMIHKLSIDDMGPPDDDTGPPNDDKEPTHIDTQTQLYDTKKRGELTLPEGLAIPKDFADCKEVDGKALARWKYTNQYLLKFVIPPKDKDKATHLSYRAALHAWCGRRFAKESDDRSLNIWARDSYAVPRTRSPRTAGEVRDLMHKKYELIPGHELPEDSTSPPPPPPGDGKPGDKPGGKPGNKAGGKPYDKAGGKPSGKSGGKPSTGGAKKPNKRKEPKKGKEADDEKKASDKNMITDAKSVDIEPRKQVLKFVHGVGSGNLPQFVNDTTKVDVWLGENPHLLGGWDRQNVHDLTAKALLHRSFKGRFSIDQKRDFRKWIKDPYAFTPEERVLRWTLEDTTTRMDAVYFDLNPPLFAKSSEDELNPWIWNLPGDQMARAEPIGKARGLLHRLYFGDFGDLRDPKDEEKRKVLTDWCASDPLIVDAREKGLYETDEEALDQLITYYHPEVTNLPDLRNSPLNWPPREYLASRGQKRKRGIEPSAKPALENAAKRHKKLNFPPNVTDLPYFPYLAGTELDAWTEANESNMYPHIDEETLPGELRARLWLLCNDSFANETHENLMKGWIRDEEVFTEEQMSRRDGHQVSPDEVARMMTERYEKRGQRENRTAKSVVAQRNEVQEIDDDGGGDVTVQDPDDRTYVE